MCWVHNQKENNWFEISAEYHIIEVCVKYTINNSWVVYFESFLECGYVSEGALYRTRFVPHAALSLPLWRENSAYEHPPHDAAWSRDSIE